MGVADAIRRAEAESPFLAMVMRREPDLTAELSGGEVAAIVRRAAARPATDASPGAALRIARRRLALAVAIGDLSGTLDFRAVTTSLSDFADHALDIAIAAAIAERTPGAEPRGFAAIALGKQGSRELNYSSDIDPIFLFDPHTLPRRPREEPEAAAVRVARRVVELLQARDRDGYVLRVDLRLRPSPEVTPIAIPVDAAIGYYEAQALPWERAAFIRARACAGDVALGQVFLHAIRPFVWRRSLDFGAAGEIADITRRIRDHHAQGQRFGPGYDLKRGRGGIREVEFFAQVHQLIHGGRDPALRAPATLDALAALAAAGRVGEADAHALADAYVALRTIEHRVQMIDDRQTHQLPEGEGLDRVARLHGATGGDALLDLLTPHVAAVARRYDTLAPAGADALATDETRLLADLAALGIEPAQEARDHVLRWRAGRYPSLRSAAARAALEAVLPELLRAFAAAPDPRAALVGFDRLVERLPSAVNIFRLLEARPGLGATLAAILAHAPTLADELGRRPDLLDGLIDATSFDAMPSVEALAQGMVLDERNADFQARLDHVRRTVGELRFALGAQVVAGRGDPLEVAGGYARVAEAAIGVLAAATVAQFEHVHGRVPGSELVILALGRMGGGAMTHASDLDLVYLFTGDFGGESDGGKPLGATLYFNRLAQRVTAALSVPTAAGPLYPVDTRLRPSGTQGPLAVTIASFEHYQRDGAWTWERMALTRARPVFGSPAARAELREVIDAALARDTGRDVVADARAMRAEMAAHKPPSGPLDAKLLPGGLVDLEFAVHARQLRHRACFAPDLAQAIDALIAAGLMAPGARGAHDLLTRWLVTLRLVAPDASLPPESTRAIIARAIGASDWEMGVTAFEITRQAVAAIGLGDDR